MMSVLRSSRPACTSQLAFDMSFPAGHPPFRSIAEATKWMNDRIDC